MDSNPVLSGPESPVSELVRTVAHIAFEVDDLDRALEGKELIDEPSSPMRGVRVSRSGRSLLRRLADLERAHHQLVVELREVVERIT